MSKSKMPLEAARRHAEEIIALLEPFCERIEIAGSIRRGKAEVSDVELVAIAKIEPILDMFGVVWGYVDLLHNQCNTLFETGVFAHRLDSRSRRAWGTKFKRMLFGDVPVDLFIATPATWGCVFTIRTGDADFSKMLVTSRRAGGACPGSLLFQNGRVWRGNTALHTPEEMDVFRALGLPFIEPEERSAETLQKILKEGRA